MKKSIFLFVTFFVLFTAFSFAQGGNEWKEIYSTNISYNEKTNVLFYGVYDGNYISHTYNFRTDEISAHEILSLVNEEHSIFLFFQKKAVKAKKFEKEYVVKALVIAGKTYYSK